MVIKFRSIADLKAYYADPVHAMVRRELLSFCDPDIRGLYELLDSQGTAEDRRATLFHAVEAAATRYMLRVDFALDSPGRSVLEVEPVAFELPAITRPSAAHSATAKLR